MTPLLLVLAALARAADHPLPEPPAASTGTVLRFTADRLDYDAPSTTLHLKGNVEIHEASRTIKGDELWLDTERRTGRSEGYLFVDDPNGAVAGENGGEFDFESGKGRLKGTSAGYGDWRMRAKEVRLTGRKKLDYRSTRFTSCDVKPAHYHFRASRVTVEPKDHLLARNVVVFLGPVPVFYLPFLYKSLAPEHYVRWRVQPGYDRRNGAYLKGTLTTSHGRWAYSKLFLDYYGSQGLGAGAELERRKGSDRGTLFGYRIRETHNGAERWGLLGAAYQSVVSSVSVQGRLQIQSDADFNNHYVRSSTLRVTPELINNGAIVYQRPKLTTRLSYSRRDVASENRLLFVKDTESYPRLDVNSAALKIWRLPWLNTFSGFADQTYERNRPFLQRTAGGGWEGTRSFNLARGLSFTPKAGFREQWYDKVQVASSTLQGVFIGRYLTENTLRWSTRAGDWDLTHSYAKRLKADSMTEDAGALDHGVEVNMLSLRDAFRPSRSVLVRAQSAYDYRVFRDRSMGFRERVQPFVGEVVYAPRPTFNVTLRDDYQLQEGNRSFIASLLRGDEERSFVALGAGWNKANPNGYLLDASFALAGGTKSWRLGAGLRSELGTTGGVAGLAADRVRLFEKELSLARSWHDFYTKLMFRFRPGGVKEATARIELRFGAAGRKDAPPRRDWEAEWYPERASIHADDRP